MITSSARLLALASVSLLATACGPSIHNLDEVGDGSGSGGSGTTASDGADGPQLTPDLPPPELSCEAQGGALTQLGGPWTLQEHLPDHAPAYGLLPGDADMLAIWRGPFYGQDPMPNFLGVRVDYTGQLTTAVAPVWERPVTQEPAVHRAAEGYVLTYCGRFDAQDHVTSQILGTDASTLVPELVRDPQGSCGAARPEGVWTGERYLFAWTDNSSDQLLVDIGDPSQTQSEGSMELASDGNLSCPPRIAVGPDAVTMVAGVGNDQIQIFRFTHRGDMLGEASLQTPPEFGVGQAAIGAIHDGSFDVFVADRWSAGLYHTRVDPEGVAPPLAPVDGATFRYADLLMLHRAGGLLLIAEANDEDGGTQIQFIATDDRGIPTAIETLGSDGTAAFEGKPAAAMHGEEAWILYTAGYEDETYDVRLAQLGCAR